MKLIEIEPVKHELIKVLIVKTRYMWGEDYDNQLIKNRDKDGGWWKYRREEYNNGDYTWFRMFGGDTTASTKDSVILEKWYQNNFYKKNKSQIFSKPFNI